MVKKVIFILVRRRSGWEGGVGVEVEVRGCVRKRGVRMVKVNLVRSSRWEGYVCMYARHMLLT